MTLLIYTMLCIILPNVVWQLCHINKNTKSVSHIVWTFIFMIYLSFALYVAEIGSIWDVMTYKRFMGAINTHPFAEGGLVPDILNIIMFMPLGFLLPLNWSNFRKCWKVALTGLGFSAIIEFCQLFNNRITDVDDLIMNTLGACAGYFVWVLFTKFMENGKNENIKKRAIVKLKTEPIMCIALGVMGECLLYNWRFV